MATRALAWVRDNHLPTGGIRVESGHPYAYPEVTGYFVPTLLAYGEHDLAAELTEWLLCIQRADGSFTDPDEGRSFVFDTGQVLRGLLAMTGIVPGAEQAARRAADYLVSRMSDGLFPQTYDGTDCPEAVHLYVLPPLVEAADKLTNSSYRAAALRSLDAYSRADGFCRVGDLTHFLAYQLEALIDLDRTEIARPILSRLAGVQCGDGAVRGRDGVRWVCSPGLAQLAICWYQLGDHRAADAAMTWLDRHQEPSGGFRGSYGAGASYKAGAEISWAVKFALDAHLRRVSAFFADHAPDFPTNVSADDGRVKAILARVSDGDRVLEVGCGKGRFLKALSSARRIHCYGVDPSPELLRSVPDSVSVREGTLERIPHDSDAFDVTFAVEAIEHSVSPACAVDELVRVTRPGGWIVIVDKHDGAWGRMECPPWERWPNAEDLAAKLREACDEVTAVTVAYEDRPKSDGLMMAWAGRKRLRLTGAEWNQVLGMSQLEESLVAEVRFNQFSAWGRTVLRCSSPGDRVLEIGSGTGKISLQMALAGRNVTCLDASSDSLAFVERCAKKLGVDVATSLVDATQPLPFADGAFDCVWSSGLLEHFAASERQDMLREWARVCGRTMINLVPNAASIAYRVGKADQERAGKWPYGVETPLSTLRDDYEAAGICVVSEFTVAPEHALHFIQDAATRRAAQRLIGGRSLPELRDWQQGYLLVTVGEVRR